MEWTAASGSRQQPAVADQQEATTEDQHDVEQIEVVIDGC